MPVTPVSAECFSGLSPVEKAQQIYQGYWDQAGDAELVDPVCFPGLSPESQREAVYLAVISWTGEPEECFRGRSQDEQEWLLFAALSGVPIGGEVVPPADPVNTVLPSVSGVEITGETLTGTTGTWTGSPTFVRAWLRCNSSGASCSVIAGETAATYVLQVADEGSTIRERVTGTNAGGSVVAESAATGVITPIPILWWKLNDGSGTAIAAAEGPVGTTDADWVTGQSGSGFALDFNGTSDNASSDAVVPYGVNTITIAAWVWLDDTAPTQILWESSADLNTNAATFHCYVDSGNINVTLRDSDAGTPRQRAEHITAPATGAWFHLLVVYNGQAADDIKIYVDGVLQGTTVDASGHVTATILANHTIFVGARNNASLFFNGRIDDFRIYSRELVQAEITAVVNDSQ